MFGNFFLRKAVKLYLIEAEQTTNLRGKYGGWALNHKLLESGRVSDAELNTIYAELFKAYAKTSEPGSFWANRGAAEMVRHLEYTLGLEQTDWTGDYNRD